MTLGLVPFRVNYCSLCNPFSCHASDSSGADSFNRLTGFRDGAAMHRSGFVIKATGLLDHGTEILAWLAALRAKVMGFIGLGPGVALSESGNPGLSASTPLASSFIIPRMAGT